MFWFCKHEWQTDKTLLRSPIEQLEKLGVTPKPEMLKDKTIRRLFQSRVVIVLTCTKCGKVKTIRESLFDESDDWFLEYIRENA